MPIYEYRCDDCEQEFDRWLHFSEADQPQECPRCHSRETHRLISTFASANAGGSGASADQGGCGSSGRFT